MKKEQESLGRPANEYFKDKYSKDDKEINLVSDNKNYENTKLGEKVGDSAVASDLALLYISLSDPVLVDKAMTTLSALFLIEDNLSDEKAEEINESRINDEKNIQKNNKGNYEKEPKDSKEPNDDKEIRNDIIGKPRVGSANKKTDKYHNFNNIVDNYAGKARKYDLKNGTLYQIEGSLDGVEGRFEWIVQNGNVTHRMFIRGGKVNGIPIKP